MLIGTTVIGLQRMMRIIRLVQKQQARAGKLNKNIYEESNLEDSNKETETKQKKFDARIVKLRKTIEEDKESFISWMMHGQANSNESNAKLQKAEQERSFALRAAQRPETQRVVGF